MIFPKVHGIGEDSVKWNKLHSDKYCIQNTHKNTQNVKVEGGYLERGSDQARGGRDVQER